MGSSPCTSQPIHIYTVESHGGKLATLVAAGLWALQGVAAAPLTGCPAFKNGTFTIHQFQLYAENGDFDTKNCILYLGYAALSPQ